MHDYYYKHGLNDLPHELPKDLPHELPKDLESWEIRKYHESLKPSQNDSLVPSLPAKMKILLIPAKKS